MNIWWVMVLAALFSALVLALEDRREQRRIHWTPVLELVIIAAIMAALAIAWPW